MSAEMSREYEDSLHWRTADVPEDVREPRCPVLVLIPDLSLDGGVTHYYRTLRLDQCGNIDYFFVNKPNTRSRVEKSFHALGIFGRFLYRMGPYALIHVNPSLNPNSFYRDWFFVAVGKLTGKKVLVFFRGWEADFEARLMGDSLLKKMFRWTYGRADRVVTLGETFRNRLLALGLDPRTPIHVDTTVADTFGVADLDDGAPTGNAEGGMTCLFLSRILQAKGVFTAIDAVSLANEKLGRRAVQLVVAGEGPDLDAAKRYAAERNGACVEFSGDVREHAKSALLARSHVLLFPTSYGEGLPNSILEAMLAGMVIVTRAAGAIPEIVETGRNGMVTTSADPADFADYLVRLVTEPSLAAEIGARNRSAAAAFTTESVRRRLLNIYRLMLLPDEGTT